jgi:chemotaxis protein methyltransferase CheR
MQADVVQDALWLRVSEFIAQNTGLHFPTERRPDLQRGLAAAATEFGFADAAGCADWLLSAPLTRPQLHRLASHLTIGETYFFRERKTFDALAEHILPELFRRRRGREQRLRLWSAACSTGEEPYSLAILVQQLLPDWRDWEVTILATDINERFLQKAIAGVYSEWSFRDSTSEFKERYFTPTSNGRFAIAPRIRNCVRFAPLNLAQEGSAWLTAGAHSMDVIFCRNVLIYFTASHASRLADNLRQALGDEGWLAVSPSECSQALFPGLRAVNFPGAIAYRKGSIAEQGSAAQVPSTAAQAPSTPGTAFPPSQSDAASQPVSLTAESPPLPLHVPAAPGAPEFSDLARKSANQGQHAAALVWSQRWIAADKIDPSAHYMHAMILQEMGEYEESRSSLQRAIYLQPGFPLAHFALGNLARSGLRDEEARRHFANALRLLHACPPDALLPESDGMTAGRLAQIIADLLAPPANTPSAEETASNGKR